MGLYSDPEVIDLAVKSRSIRDNPVQLNVLLNKIVSREHQCSDAESMKRQQLEALRVEIEDWL